MKDYYSDPTDKKILELIAGNDTIRGAWRSPLSVVKASLHALRSGIKKMFADKDALGGAKRRKMNFGYVGWAGLQAYAKNLSIAPAELFDRMRYLMFFKRVPDMGSLVQEAEGVPENGEIRFNIKSTPVLEKNWKERIVTETSVKSPVTLEEYEAMDRLERRNAQLEVSKISREELEAHIEHEKDREAKVPVVGSIAPDFIADVLGANRKRTGKSIRLSNLRGKPVAIAFGSFT